VPLIEAKPEDRLDGRDRTHPFGAAFDFVDRDVLDR
jgi:hypothetical protein